MLLDKVNLFKHLIMEAVQIREKLHQFIDEIEDKKVEAMYMLFENDIDADAARKKMVQLEAV